MYACEFSILLCIIPAEDSPGTIDQFKNAEAQDPLRPIILGGRNSAVSFSQGAVIRIVIIDSQEVYRTGLRCLCQGQPDFQIIADFPSIQHA